MKPTVLEKKLRTKLAAEGIAVAPGSRAERGLKLVSTVGADVATKGERAVRTTRTAIGRAVESARAAIHEATKPAPPRRTAAKKK